MIDLYTWKTPNGRKISIMLEETGLPYTIKPIDISKGDQQTTEFLAISPNGKIPAIIDHDSPVLFPIFESAAILIYLADKSLQLLPTSGPARYDALAWLSWQVAGLGPMFGQLGYFFRQPERNEGAIARYTAESVRLMQVMDARLKLSPYLGGAEYSIADIAAYPWIAAAMSMMKEALPPEVRNLTAVTAWTEAIAARPAVQKGMALPE